MPIGNPLTAVWQYDDSASAFVNNTVEAQLDNGTAFDLLGEAADYHYFGFSRRHDALLFVLGTVGSYSSFVWEYGAAIGSWVQFVPTKEYRIPTATPGYMRWDPRGSTLDSAWTSFALTSDAPHGSVASVPDSTARYWIRVSVATVTTVATVNSVVCRPYVSYASALDVQKQLQLQTAFSSSTTPALFDVEDFIRGAEDQLVYQMGRSWRVEFEEDELINFKAYGMKLRYEDIINMYELAVYNGNTFEVKTEGRDQDFFVTPVTGMIFIATIFLDAMPPNFRRSYSERLNQGAFKRAVRVNYSWGRDIRKDKLGVQVGRIAVKQACIDIVTDLDFSVLIPLGLDTVSLQAKIDNWSQDIEKFLDLYAKLRMV